MSPISIPTEAEYTQSKIIDKDHDNFLIPTKLLYDALGVPRKIIFGFLSPSN